MVYVVRSGSYSEVSGVAFVYCTWDLKGCRNTSRPDFM